MAKRFYVILIVLTCWAAGADRCILAENIPAGRQETECVFTPQDRAVFDRVIPVLVQHKWMPGADLMIMAAHQLMGTPYVAGTLEQEPERLTVNLHETDCILFVETCLALARTVKSDTPDFQTFCNNIRNLRYRNGRVDGYTSRIHYTSEWIRQAEARGWVKEISRDLSGQNANQRFSFMSTHADRYKQLAGNPADIQKIKEIETELNRYEYYFIPAGSISAAAPQIHDGDIVGFNTTVAGLDLSHVGMAFFVNGELHFIHASMGKGKVIVESRSMTEYLSDNRSNNGIRIIRPVF